MADKNRFPRYAPCFKYFGVQSCGLVLIPIALLTLPSLAQSPTGNSIRIDGSGSMANINQSLKQGFEQQTPGSTVTFQTNGTTTGLQALSAGKIDLAAIGRTLTPQEAAQGLVFIPIKREKIAMIVGSDNPYSGNMNIAQFAQMFRGEIKDWSEVGRQPGAVRFIDQPDASDTRNAFTNYPTFKTAPFQNGSTTVKVSDETATAIAQALGNNGIGYVIADQAKQLPGVKIVEMHATKPDDPRYPFSHVLGYVYKQGSLTPATQTFLGYIAQPAGKELLKASGTNGAEIIDTKVAVDSAIATAVPAPAISATPNVAPAAPPTAQPAAIPTPVAEIGGATTNPPAPPQNGWLWWALLPLGAGIAWWALKGRNKPAVAPNAEPMGLPVAGVREQVDIGPTVAPAVDSEAIAATPETFTPSPRAIPPFGTTDSESASSNEPVQLDLLNPAATSASFQPITERPATAEPSSELAGTIEEIESPIGEANIDNAPRFIDPTALATAATLAGAGTIAANFFVENPNVDDSPRNAGNNSDDVSNVSLPISLLGALESPPDLSASNDLTQSNVEASKYNVGQPASQPPLPNLDVSNDLTQSNVEASKYDVGHPPEPERFNFSREELATVDQGLADLPDGYGNSRIILMSRDPQWGYTYWDVPNEARQQMRDRGGQQLALRLYDVTDIDVSNYQPHSMQQYGINEMARNYYMPIPVSDRDYVAEIGYITTQGEWLSLARSNTVRIPPVYPSDWIDDQAVTIPWDQELRGKKFGNLIRSIQQTTTTHLHEQMFKLSWPQGDRTDGSMQQSGMSSFIFPSGAGIWSLPNVSGINMSGIGMSGIGMSGIGMSVSQIRSRNFWLVADAQLIVYGATEPDAAVTIDGAPVRLNPDGTFRIQISFQDGKLAFPIVAIAKDGEQTRQVKLKFERTTHDRNTNTKAEAKDDWF